MEYLHFKHLTPNSATVIFHTSYISLSQTVEHIQNERETITWNFVLKSSHYHNRVETDDGKTTQVENCDEMSHTL